MAKVSFAEAGPRTPSTAEQGILLAIDGGSSARAAVRRRRDYLGASLVGKECKRAVQLDYLADAYEGSPAKRAIDPRLQRIFDTGHALEELGVRWMREAGFELVTRRRDGTQFGFSDAEGAFRGNADGVLVDGPDAMAYPGLWEFKGVNDRGFQELVRKGVAKAYPHYHAQMQTYMAHLDLDANPGLLLVVNKNNCDLHAELVPFDARLAQKVTDDAVSVLDASEQGIVLPKGGHAPEAWVCRFCDWKSYCWPAEA